MKPFKRKDVEKIDPNELLPFCTRCFHIGAACDDDHNNFCHMCGSQGTCIPIRRKDAIHLENQVSDSIQYWYAKGKERGQDGKEQIIATIVKDSYVCNAGFWTEDYDVETEGTEDFDDIKKKFEGKKVKITIEKFEEE